MRKKSVRREGNLLLAGLSPEAYRSVLERTELMTLNTGKVIADSEQPIGDVYFPVTAVLSVLSIMTDKSGVETAVVGHEGMAPLGAFHGVDITAEQVMVQVPGEALRMRRADFDEAVARIPELRTALHRFSQALFTFAAQTSGCNRKHSVVQRCARWLLVTHDRVPGDEFYLTHLFLAQMLGVRRSSVTISAEALRSAGAISYTRGKIRILDREILHARSCECYDIIRSTYDRLLEGIPTPSPLSGLALSDGQMSLAHAGDPSPNQPPPDGLPADAAQPYSGEDFSTALEALQVAQEELRAQVEALESMRDSMESQHEVWRSRFDGLPDAFIETDHHDRIIELNSAAEELLGRDRSYLMGKPLAALVSEGDRRGLRDVVSKLRHSGDEARWHGALLSGNSTNSAVDVTVAVARAAGSDATALSLSHQRRGQFVGARWLLRPDKVAPKPHLERAAGD